MTLYSPVLLVLTDSDVVRYLLHNATRKLRYLGGLLGGYMQVYKKKHRHILSNWDHHLELIREKIPTYLTNQVVKIKNLTYAETSRVAWLVGNHGSITLIGCLGVLASAKSANGELTSGSPYYIPTK